MKIRGIEPKDDTIKPIWVILTQDIDPLTCWLKDKTSDEPREIKVEKAKDMVSKAIWTCHHVHSERDDVNKGTIIMCYTLEEIARFRIQMMEAQEKESANESKASTT